MYYTFQVSAKKRKEKERFNVIKDKLKEEEKKQQEHCGRVEARLKQESAAWFTQRKYYPPIPWGRSRINLAWYAVKALKKNGLIGVTYKKK